MIAVLLLAAAVVLAVLHAVGVGGRVHLGWLAFACVIASIPAGAAAL
ncbi:hypothetical protein BDK92_7234 [Micromonospora pisi]|uniref:Uncharacterized protein n=1 Tax=Micromonospora pisi TaxID=589240 RepID=A0A495JWX1_9ACTN|nr:hypothetical protein [Micromonospora pisi]RKR92754.1 hypothetical protein BDK92_7234 [Micromonospora pisi]